ncbi:hypothetical protein ACWCQX_40050, partial [Streptomyces sp. NPDC002346]
YDPLIRRNAYFNLHRLGAGALRRIARHSGLPEETFSVPPDHWSVRPDLVRTRSVRRGVDFAAS